MSDDGPIYEGRKATGRYRHQQHVIRRVESENIPKFSAEDYERLRAGAAGARRKDMREDFSEPELSHPGEDIEGRVRAGMSSGMAKAATLRDVGKKAFLGVVKETVDLVALEAASKALQEAIEEEQQASARGTSTTAPSRRAHANGTSSRSKSSATSASASQHSATTSDPRSPPPISASSSSDPPSLQSNDSASGSAFDVYSPKTRRSSGRRPGTSIRNGSAARHANGGRSERVSGATPPQQQRPGKSDSSWIRGAANRAANPATPEKNVSESGASWIKGLSRRAAEASLQQNGGGSRSSLVNGAGKRTAEPASPEQNGDGRAGGVKSREVHEDEEQENGAPEFRNSASEMDDQERSMLLGLLSQSYNQVNELTDELQMSLQKLSETELQLKELTEERGTMLPHANGDCGDAERSKRVELEPGDGGDGKKDEAAAAEIIRQLEEELQSLQQRQRHANTKVERLQQKLLKATTQEEKLRQRVQQANAKEEKHRTDLARSQRLVAAMEQQIKDGTLNNSPRGMSSTGGMSRTLTSLQRSDSRPVAGTLCVTPGGTNYQDGVTKPLVARVAELEEKLVSSSMENATAKQDYLTIKLRNSQLEKDNKNLEHQLAKSEAMNDLLQNEIDRLQGISPEGEADGSGWRRWLGGVQEPLALEPLSPEPVKVESGDSDSPVVVVRDLDNNQLVYAPSRAEFM